MWSSTPVLEWGRAKTNRTESSNEYLFATQIWQICHFFSVESSFRSADPYRSPVENCALSLEISPACAFQELPEIIGVSLQSLRFCLSFLSSLEYREIRNNSSVRCFLLVRSQQESRNRTRVQVPLLVKI